MKQPKGIKIDFNNGAQIRVPKGNYHVRFTDMDTMTVLFESDLSDAMATSTKKYYVNFRIELWEDGKPLLTHDLNLSGRNVLIVFPIGTLGDMIAWFPYAEAFRIKHGCNMYCSMDKDIAALFEPNYPDIHFIEPKSKVPDCYASYYMGIFSPEDNAVHQPVDHRITGLQLCIPLTLGLDSTELKPKLTVSPKRTIKEPYVCIAVKSTGYAKFWNNPSGWDDVSAYLKKKGYRVLCVDKEKTMDIGVREVGVPEGAEDFTGDLPLQERVDLIGHADFFIGLSSGLSWLAWGAGVPVIMISGFTLPHNEFHTPYRVINYHVCNGCWNDCRAEYDLKDFYSCPRHSGTDRAFECTRLISSGHVCKVIDRLMEDHKLGPLK